MKICFRHLNIKVHFGQLVSFSKKPFPIPESENISKLSKNSLCIIVVQPLPKGQQNHPISLISVKQQIKSMVDTDALTILLSDLKAIIANDSKVNHNTLN